MGVVRQECLRYQPIVQTKATVKISVIIAVLDDFSRLRTCLDALARQTLGVQQLEVLVVDNGSKEDPEPQLADYPFVRVLRESTPGSYAARNAALPVAHGRILAFTDSDCLPTPGWL